MIDADTTPETPTEVPLAEDTITAAAGAARGAKRRAGDAIKSLREVPKLSAGQRAEALGATAIAESNLAVTHELRALRLMLAQQLPALRPQR